MTKGALAGTVIRLQSGFYTVQCAESELTCSLRGRLKRTRGERGDFIAVGDKVRVDKLQDGGGVIEEIEPRRTALVRLAPTPRGEYRQVLLANLDQVVFVFACANPEPHIRMLDRFLVISEKQDLPAVIVVNKTDLVTETRIQELFGVYPGLGYSVLYTSIKTGTGLEGLREKLTGRLSGLAGPSGVGKSSLLNALQPGLGLCVREVSSLTGRGQHTTVVRQLFALDGGGFVAEPEELDGYFPELRELVRDCQYNDCTHQFEPGCEVRRAVEDGRVSLARYESYVRLRFGEIDKAENSQPVDPADGME
jgi:ribosome biogenesis GTPase